MDPERPQGRLDSLPAPLRGLGGLLALLVLAAALAFAVLNLTGVLEREEVEPQRIFETALEEDAGSDPFAWEADRRKDFEQRATLGNSHVLYELSPGGVIASAERTARWRDEIEAAADEHGVNADLMEAMVLLESAGRPQVIAGASDPAAASGLAQIVASTGIDLLGMPIDLSRSRALTTLIIDREAKAAKLRKRAARQEEKSSRKAQRKAKRLSLRARRAEDAADAARRERVRVDPRFDPEAALDGMGTYLELATERFGREDLAITSYHMGIGNLGDVIDAYAGPDRSQGTARETVDDLELSYAQLFFDSSPTNNRDAWKVLAGFADDSRTYYWRVLAGLEIMRLYRTDREALRELDRLHGNKATAEEVFHPESETRVFDDPDELREGLEAGELVTIPPGRELGYRVGPQLGELTKQLGVERDLYRALRPEALATLIYMAGRVQAITGKSGPRQRLTVTSAVRDRGYQEALVGRNAQATRAYSLHTTGYSFDILRDYASDEQAAAFQHVLDRLKSLGVIDWAREPRAIHVTVSDQAEPLLE